MVSVDFGHTSIKDKSGSDSNQRLVNGYAEQVGQSAKSPLPVYSLPGTVRFDTGSTGLDGPCRGMMAVHGKGLYVLGGSKVCLFDDTGAPTPCTGVAVGGSDMAIMAANQHGNPELAIVANGTYYHVDTQTNVVSEPALAALPAPCGVAFLDGYLVFAIPDGRMFTTGINDALTVSALAYATAESKAAGLRGVWNHRGAIIVLTEAGMEIWEDAGTVPFPLNRIRANIAIGCIAEHSVAEVAQTLIWVDHLGIVRQLTASEPQRISHHTLERAIAGLTFDERRLLHGTVVELDGHSFYALTSPYWTWEFDLATGLWHERASGGLDHWFARGWEQFNSKNIVGSSLDASIHVIDETAQDESGTAFTLIAQSAPVHKFPNGLIFDELDVDIVPGVGLTGGGADIETPSIVLDWSDDAGKTWQGGRQASLGKVGETRATAAFHQLGSCSRHGRTFRLSSSSSVMRGILLAEARTRTIKV
jgi:hypothetical protein